MKLKRITLLVLMCLFFKAHSQAPAGANLQIQYNNNGSFGASPYLRWDGTNLRLEDMGSSSARLYFNSESGDHSYIFSENYGSNLNRLVINTQDDGDGDYVVFRNKHWSYGDLDVFEIRRSYLLARGSRNWSETNQGHSRGIIHLDPENTTDHYGSAITFGASDSGDGENAHAGIYVRSDGSYGTKMYFATTNSYAQGAKTGMMLNHHGNLGIGTVSPNAKVDVQGTAVSGSETLMNFDISDATNDYLRIRNATNATSQFIPSIYGYHTSDNRQALYLTGAIAASNDVGSQPITVFDSRIGGSQVTVRPLFAWDSYGNRKMILTADGYLGIGTQSPDEKLTVNGNIHTKEVRVDLSVPGPDYVFEEDYALRSLEETEAYIKANKHLPEIPSAKEMEENGVVLGEMNMLLLKKIEELTLYVIELKDENKTLRDNQKTLTNRIELLEDK